MSQWILESGRGTSKLSKELLNFGGLKYRPELASVATSVLIKVPSERSAVRFCKFETVEDFIKGYWLFIGRSPYKGWEKTNTALGYITHIKRAGYATDPGYVSKVRKQFSEAIGLLEVKDTGPITDPNKKYPKPVFKTLPRDIQFDRQGYYKTPTGHASGLVVHYTVSGRSEKSAIGVARYMASKGLGCMVMDGKGQIWIPAGWDFTKRRDDHAGKSEWLGFRSVSQVFMGMEMCNWGLGAKSRTAKKPWRKISKKVDNRDRGIYQSYTQAQVDSLIGFCLWAKENIPGFTFANVCGHDECAARRKSDPGGALDMSMPEFRAKLERLYRA